MRRRRVGVVEGEVRRRRAGGVEEESRTDVVVEYIHLTKT